MSSSAKRRRRRKRRRKTYTLEQLPMAEERDAHGAVVDLEDMPLAQSSTKGFNSVMRALEAEGPRKVARVVVASRVNAVLRQSLVAAAKGQGVPVVLVEASSSELGEAMGMTSCICVGVLV